MRPDFGGCYKFFGNERLLEEVNATLISLVPKVATPSKDSKYRPIACCNVLYKCISKILTNRIRKALKGLVDENQSAFISGRQIQDNIMLAQEFLKGYNHKARPKRCSFTIDVQKAYDTIKIQLRYLGVLLITRSLGIKQCKFLVDIIKSRVHDWRSKSLSFVERLQLIMAVLASTQVYWSFVFLIPKTMIKDINKVLKSFLWSQDETSKGKVKIAWSSVSKPKNKGGLGIKNLSS
ncbi:RNA-directed DNA polymerase, eukaryota, reverse transcriptase zinc-binding domain protein [Tanacetum coccineum]